MKKTQAGFSLVELSIVLVVVGLLLGTTIAGLSDFIWHARNAQAKKDLALIEEALIGYAISNGGLPCPDADGYPNNPDGANGMADALGGICSNDEGFLPWADLGLKSRDPWGVPYLYRVDTNYAKPPPVIDQTVVFTATDTDGTIEVRNTTGGSIIANRIAALFLSVGPNGYQHLTGTAVASTDESANFDNDAVPGTFVERAYQPSTAADSGFDDILDWVSSFTLKSKMVQAQRLP